MPPLENPRWELFAQKIVEGLVNGHEAFSQGRAYSAAGYIAKGDAADVNASRLLRKAREIGERVQEIQAAALAKLERKLDVSRERVGRRLDKASRMAETEGNAANMVAAEMGIAKVFGLAKASDNYNPIDPSNAQSMHEIGRLLLESVGTKSPSQTQINLAVEANNAFVARLEAIRINCRIMDLLSTVELNNIKDLAQARRFGRLQTQYLVSKRKKRNHFALSEHFFLFREMAPRRLRQGAGEGRRAGAGRGSKVLNTNLFQRSGKGTQIQRREIYGSPP